MRQRFRVLLIEHDTGYENVIQAHAVSVADEFEVTTVRSIPEALGEIARCAPDAVISDLQLPGSHGVEALTALGAALTRETPIIALSAVDDPWLARQAIDAGAQEFLVKDRADGDAVIRALRSAIHRSTIRRRLKESEAALRDSEARKTAVLDSAFDAIVTMNAQGLVFEINAAAERIFGYTKDEVVGRELATLIVPPEYREQHRRALASYQPGRPSRMVGRRIELDAMRSDGTRLPVELSIARLDTADGVIFTAWIRDLTERHTSEEALRQSEAQLRQAQKMEAIGRLAGGVAHDFNNVLTAIFGYADLLMDSFEPQHPGRADVLEIRRAAERAANLTRQLLAFSRKQVLQPRRVNLNDVVASLETLLERLIGEDIQLETRLDESAGEVRADPGQIEQVLMNLAANARDAMPEGGRLVISTANVDISADAAREHPGFEAGQFVLLSVTDTGHGIPEDVRRHIFEPFFTTKEQGKGTGLGLATVYGIVKQSGGWIYIGSQLGNGTTFSIYLSRVDAAEEDRRPADRAPEGPTSSP